jgi:glutamate synthase domain-containing protein 2/glutamate synthase domain-containing protein 1/glutamate synthase domain-containing protein 3
VNGLPAPGGLYHPRNERDGCGVACLARLDGVASRETVQRGIDALVNLEHRGAEGADPTTGDGAGILMQIPDRFLRAEVRFELPEAGAYGLAMCFLPQDAGRRASMEELIEVTARREGLEVLGWRDVPIDAEHAGTRSREVAPHFRQAFFVPQGDLEGDDLERALYIMRKRVENEADGEMSLPSCSSRTVVYKGMLSAPQLSRFYTDLADERVESALAIVHSRFSTNTFPSWQLAHPFHMSAHNGEFNTLLGNVSWMRAREARLSAGPLGKDVARTLPAIPPGASDSAAFDAVLELLVQGGRTLPHAVMLMTPEAHEGRPDMPEELSDFYDYGSMLMEPWDGPASVTFTDGRILGATLDRNGLRPGRWVVTRDGWFALASEAGAFQVPSEDVERVGRLLPGRLLVVDPQRGGLLEDREAEREVARGRPYGAWYGEHSLGVEDLPAGRPAERPLVARQERQLAFGWSQEDLRTILAPMTDNGTEAVGSMGNDAALATLSERQPPLFSYFKQLFAQVTNPAIDPVREKIVMSLRSIVGPEGDLFEETQEQARRLVLEQPVLTDDELSRIRAVESGPLTVRTLDATWPIEDREDGMERALDRLCSEADAAVEDGIGVLVISDRNVGPRRAPLPSLLALSSVHHHLVRAGTRTRAGMIVETGEAREPHHIASLIGYGAAAVNPYLMLECAGEQHDKVIASMGKSLLKVISKMGISTIRSYNGAQVFEAVGLDPELVARHFTGTPSRIGGIGMDGLAHEALERHARAWPHEHGEALPDHVEEALLPAASGELLPQGGVYQWRRDGERHMWDPETITGLQRVARGAGPETYAEFAQHVNDENAAHGMLRGLMKLRTDRQSVPLSDVEPAIEVVKRFTTGAMSLGSLSSEAHETLAIAMNRLGGRSNTGEGGEDPRRFAPDPNGDLRRSAIKQVASGRFGVTTDYLVNADQIQIKVAQGAKPGEGGQLPGHKITAEIGRLRHSTPGVELISPPPHHDIYSIEDLKQLIYDLRCANPRASVSVKLAAEVGVGTVAAGVVKANADHIVIAGHDGGTGAAAMSSIHNAGVPWEIGLAEAQQTLIRNDLRSRVMLQADGQMRTGRDVVIAALLGADEVGFSTAPLVATGCVMMRVCHLNTCPVGVATQDPELRKRFAGKPEHVVRYLLAVAEEVRSLMASLGFTRYQDMVGQVELLEMDDALEHWKAQGIDLTEMLSFPDGRGDRPRRHEDPPTPVLDNSVDHIQLLPAAAHAIQSDEPVRLRRTVANVHRTVGGLLSGEIVRRRGPQGLPESTIDVVFEGSAGQSFGAWLAPGVTFTVEGTVNDYSGKGMSGGIIAVRPPAQATFDPDENVIAGNVALYGATSGRAFFRGLAGERFCVRNSGAHAVVEGVGDHGCEYMTGGRVVVLGPTGVNFAAGMSGGIAWVLDDHGDFAGRCNQEMVDLEPPAEEDADELRDLLAEHYTRTGSTTAKELLDDESSWARRLVRVMPRDYRAALERASEDRHRTEEAPA